MIKLAVVGIGRMGGRHARNLIKGVVKNARLVAVCDTDGDRLSEFCGRYKVAGFADHVKMIEEVRPDGVIIATPHYSHVSIALDCVERDVNILVEKPISVTVKEACRLTDALAEKPRLIAAMMFNQRTNRLYRKAKQLIESGALGDIQRVNFTVTDWYRTQFYYDMGGWRASWSGEGGGTLINQCVHQLDILQWLIGMPENITAFCRTVDRDITTENDVTAVMRYKNFDCVFTASTHELPGTRLLEIAGDRGKLSIGKYSMRYVRNKMSEREVNARATRDYGNSQDKKTVSRTYRYGLSRLIFDGIYGQQARILKNFASAIESGDSDMLIARAEEGLNGLALINAMNMSAWMCESVAMPADCDRYADMLAEKIEEEKNIKV